jgi:hypothetical protein
MRTDSSRRAAVASLPSLLAMGVAFFLPFVRGCQTMVSPIGFSMESAHRPLLLLWVVPRFAVAALLAVLTWILVARKRAPDRASERIAWAGLTASVGALGADWWMTYKDAFTHPVAVVPLAALCAVTLLSGWLLVAARRHTSWARWERLIAAHAALSMPLCGFVVAAGAWSAVGIGGYAYTTSIAILTLLFVLSKRQSALS